MAPELLVEVCSRCRLSSIKSGGLKEQAVSTLLPECLPLVVFLTQVPVPVLFSGTIQLSQIPSSLALPSFSWLSPSNLQAPPSMLLSLACFRVRYQKSLFKENKLLNLFLSPECDLHAWSTLVPYSLLITLSPSSLAYTPLPQYLSSQVNFSFHCSPLVPPITYPVSLPWSSPEFLHVCCLDCHAPPFIQFVFHLVGLVTWSFVSFLLQTDNRLRKMTVTC
ncbi:hypothetical protein ATANTOWER_026143 [Ataeniobius toweri]|uniref:Uncharacterized protein n=1 Tax=Ataeniobius toweri TaxID=208326 RepID=A0ABU7BXT9_9TELE|nr:hypothetical protein [Ataeniobius toweri]